MGSDLKNKRHLFFDLDDTLWDFEKNSSVVLEELFHEFELAGKLNTEFHQFKTIYKSINQQLWDRYYKKEIDKHYVRNARFHLTFRHFNYDNPGETVLIGERYIGRAPHGKVLKENCIDTLEYLKEKYELHIITNGFKETQVIKIDGNGLRIYFSQILISEEHELRKPDQKLFKLAERMTGADSHECVMIGDNFECDVEGALNAGWEAVYFSERVRPDFVGHRIGSLRELKTLF
jgi:putative hydrolase of the HAD superfamily